jgi:hypothetical protein
VNIKTVKMMCESVATRWQEQYSLCTEGDKYEISQRLLALNGKGSPEEIAEIIGNSMWTDLGCDSCSKSVGQVVRIPVGDGEYSTFLCEACCREAHAAFHSA